MLKDCRKSKIDLILVKSLSRFGRDAKETMTTIRRLKQMGIGVYIELGGINTLTSPHLIKQRVRTKATISSSVCADG